MVELLWLNLVCRRLNGMVSRQWTFCDDFVACAERWGKREGSAKTTVRECFAVRLKELNLHFLHSEIVGGFYGQCVSAERTVCVLRTEYSACRKHT